MVFYFDNDYLKLPPLLRYLVKIFKEVVAILLTVLALFFLISDTNFYLIKSLSLTYLFFLSVLLIINRNSKEDILFFKHAKNISQININNFLNKEASNFIVDSLTKAELLKPVDFYIFLMFEFCKKNKIKNIIFRLNVNYQKLIEAIKNSHLKQLKEDKHQNYKDKINAILINAFNISKKLNSSSISLYSLFFAFIDEAYRNESTKEIFDSFDIKKDYFFTAIILETFANKRFFIFRKNRKIFVKKPFLRRGLFFNRVLSNKPTYLLDKYSIDLTYFSYYNVGSLLIGHQDELEQIITVLSTGGNVLLIGDEGSGKEAIIQHLAWLIHNDLAPKNLLDYRVVKVNLSLLLTHKSRFYELATQIFNEVIDSGYIILYFPYLEDFLFNEDLNIFEILSPLLRSKLIPIVVTMSLNGYAKVAASKITFDNFFEKVVIKPLNDEEAMNFLVLKVISWEKDEKIIITPRAIATAISLSKTFLTDQVLEKAAETLILEGIALAKKYKSLYVDEEIIAEIVFEKTKIPIKSLKSDEREILLNLENILHQRIVNQRDAISAIVKALRIYRAGLDKNKGTIGSFLFVGPTGVGKTETAKALSKVYYHSEKAMIRLDMVEFQTEDSLENLIGSRDGKILGMLTEPVRQNPYSLILLDEFEKTHPSILKLFLPIFDEGVIKDALGREISFKNTLIICTSNAYSEYIKESIDNNENFDKIIEVLKNKLLNIFSIELLNRFDQIVVFKPLQEKELFEIAKILLQDFKNNMLLKHNIELEVSDKAILEIVRLGIDPIYGARPLQRKINDVLTAEIANLFLKEELRRGQKVFVDFDQQFRFLIK